MPMTRNAGFAFLALLGACSYIPRIPGMTPYRIDIQQGNYVTQEMVSQLKPGMALVIPVDPETGPHLRNGLPADPIRPGVLVCPILGAPVIQRFGPTNFALEPAYAGYAHFHSGVDILAEYGTPINAAAGGRVTAAGEVGYFGIRVEVRDSYGLVEIYAHMSDISVAVGQEVQQGQLVGHVGSTGMSIGAHLHLQLEIGGLPTDPGPLAGCG